jgi:hypothetical protein
MRCPTCQKENPDGTKFCGFCGATLIGPGPAAGEAPEVEAGPAAGAAPDVEALPPAVPEPQRLEDEPTVWKGCYSGRILLRDLLFVLLLAGVLAGIALFPGFAQGTWWVWKLAAAVGVVVLAALGAYLAVRWIRRARRLRRGRAAANGVLVILLLTLVLVRLVALLFGDGRTLRLVTWALAAAVAALTLVYLVLYWLKMRLSRRYRLTPVRLWHEQGIFNRLQDQIELNYINDLRVWQGLWDRVFGVGDITVLGATKQLEAVDRIEERLQVERGQAGGPVGPAEPQTVATRALGTMPITKLIGVARPNDVKMKILLSRQERLSKSTFIRDTV